MTLRITALALLVLNLSYCSDQSPQNHAPQVRPDSLNAVRESDVDSSFNHFIEHFSADQGFQTSRIRFPLAFWQYDIEKDTTVYVTQNEVERMDFRQQHSTGQYDKWQQTIVPHKNNNNKVTIQIRGIDNGIMVDYLFEKHEGKWMLVAIHDLST